MKTLMYTSPYGYSYELAFEKNTYIHNGSMYLGLIDMEDGCSYADVTVCLENFAPTDENCAYIDVNNMGADIIKWLTDNGLGELTHNIGFSGYCVYPEFAFNMDVLNEYLIPETEGSDNT